MSFYNLALNVNLGAMVKFLIRVFVKNSSDVQNAEVRTKYGIVLGAFGIFLNLVLFALKFVFGTISKSVAMVADAFNNLSDGASSLVSILGFKLSLKKPDKDHPFGHGRLEYISGLVISFLILLMGFELLRSSFSSIFSSEKTEFSYLSVFVMIFAILVKFYMCFYNHQAAKKLGSVALEATAKDSLSDTISTFVVLSSAFAGRYTNFPVDAVAGMIVGIFIIKEGFDSAKETVAPLLGEAPSKEFVKQVEEELLRHKPILAMHDIVVHDYGPGRRMISLHAEVPGDRNIFSLHDAIDNAEKDISQKFNCSTVIHMDPVQTHNPLLEDLKKHLKIILFVIDPDLTAHDIRIVPGTTHSNLIFDVVKPFSSKLSDSELKKKIDSAVKIKFPNVNTVVTVDVPFD